MHPTSVTLVGLDRAGVVVPRSWFGLVCRLSLTGLGVTFCGDAGAKAGK